MDWHDLLVIYSYLGIDSHVYCSLNPEYRGWTLTNQLLATIADCLRWLRWAKTEDGHNNIGMPEPIERPGLKKGRGHPRGKGLPRSKFQKLFKRDKGDQSERLAKLRKLFSTADDAGD